MKDDINLHMCKKIYRPTVYNYWWATLKCMYMLSFKPKNDAMITASDLLYCRFNTDKFTE